MDVAFRSHETRGIRPPEFEYETTGIRLPEFELQGIVTYLTWV